MTTEPGDGDEDGNRDREEDRGRDEDGERDREEVGDRDDSVESPGAEATGEPAVSDDDRTWGALAHASAFIGFVVPFGNVLGPLIVWLIKRDESRFVDESGTQALNFQLTWTLLLFVALVSLVVGVGLLLLPIIGLAWLILVTIATVRASDGQVYEYPLTIDFVSAGR